MLGQVCPKREVPPTARSLEFGIKSGKKLVSMLATLCKCLCVYINVGGGRSIMSPTSFFVPREAIPPLPDALEEG